MPTRRTEPALDTVGPCRRRSPRPRSAPPPRCSCTIISTVDCARRRSSSWPSPDRLRRAAHHGRRGAGDLVPRGCGLRLPGALPRDVRPHRGGHADARAADPRVAREAAEDLADDGVVYAEIRWAPEQHVDAGLSLDEVVEAVIAGFRQGERAAAQRGKPIRVGALVTAMRHAARSREIAELAVRYRDRRRGRIRHRRRRGRLPAHPPSGRVRVPAPRELPLHHPRRRGVRAAVDLGGDPVVRHRPARPRRAHHRRHHAPRVPAAPRRPPHARLGRLAAVRARQAHPAGDVPVLERPDRGGVLDRRRTRSGCCAGCTSGSR